MSFVCDSETAPQLKTYANMLVSFLSRFSWLSDAYILDFFTERHWSKLPILWQHVLSEMDFSELFNLMNPESKQFKTVLPLSLLAYRSTTFALTWPRAVSKPCLLEECLRKFTSSSAVSEYAVSGNRFGTWKNGSEEVSAAGGQHEHLDHIFRRHVKPKKQHEIYRCAEVVDIVCSACKCSHVLDIGSGQGHLSRFLGFKYGLNVMSIEGNGCHISGAEKFDSQTLKDLRKKKKVKDPVETFVPNTNVRDWQPPKHINYFISPSYDKEQFLEIISQNFKRDDQTDLPRLALLGLHTCGNLASTMLRLFAETPEICTLMSVGCCYMKLDSDGFPLSNLDPKFNLSYQAKEVSCHALEQYILRIRDGSDSLKIHCFRATLEVLIQKYYPELKHLGLRSISHSSTMTFDEYARKAIFKRNIEIPDEEYQSTLVTECLSLWKQVVIFYSLRLMIAPLIESFILLDRMFYLLEMGFPTCLVPVFDSGISPRNHILISLKNR